MTFENWTETCFLETVSPWIIAAVRSFQWRYFLLCKLLTACSKHCPQGSSEKIFFSLDSLYEIFALLKSYKWSLCWLNTYERLTNIIQVQQMWYLLQGWCVIICFSVFLLYYYSSWRTWGVFLWRRLRKSGFTVKKPVLNEPDQLNQDYSVSWNQLWAYLISPHQVWYQELTLKHRPEVSSMDRFTVKKTNMYRQSQNVHGCSAADITHILSKINKIKKLQQKWKKSLR